MTLSERLDYCRSSAALARKQASMAATPMVRDKLLKMAVDFDAEIVLLSAPGAQFI